jgi:hypothetical protein
MLIALIWAAMMVACGGDEATGPVSSTVGPDGGTLSFTGGRVTLVFPSGALTDEVAVTVNAAAGPAPSSLLVPGTAFEFGPAGIQFAKPVELAIGYDPGVVPAGIRENELQLSRAVAAAWQPLMASSVDLTRKT